jgi:hypothetical protein
MRPWQRSISLRAISPTSTASKPWSRRTASPTFSTWRRCKSPSCGRTRSSGHGSMSSARLSSSRRCVNSPTRSPVSSTHHQSPSMAPPISTRQVRSPTTRLSPRSLSTASPRKPTRAGLPSTGRTTRCRALDSAPFSSMAQDVTRASARPRRRGWPPPPWAVPTISPSAGPIPTSTPTTWPTSSSPRRAQCPRERRSTTWGAHSPRSQSAGTITFAPEPLFTPDGVEGKAVESLLGPIAWRPLEQGVQDTIDALRAAARAGRLDADRATA